MFENQKLIVSDDTAPKFSLEPGKTYHVSTVNLVDASSAEPSRVAARLCGGTGTCLALMEIEPPKPAPSSTAAQAPGPVAPAKFFSKM